MNEKERKEKKSNEKIKVENKEGLTISYNKEEVGEFFPHLIKELSEKKKSIKINAFNDEIERISKDEQQGSNNLFPNELYNPGVVDFIRRCTTKEEAINILDYLLKRNEITNNDYDKFKNIISQEHGLEKFIKDSGGLKRPGYYMRKYYKKNINNQKLNNNNA